MKSRSNIEKTFNKRLFVSRLLYSLLAVVLSVLLFPLSSFATHSKVLLESADALGGNAMNDMEMAEGNSLNLKKE